MTLETDYCNTHIAHQEHLERLDGRISDAESDIDDLKKQVSEVERLIARIDTLVGQLQKTYWILVTAVAGGAVTWIFTALQPLIHS